jgi:glycerol-3-phosphate dehydrogenase
MRPLAAGDRPEVLDRLAARSYDVLVVGGGATGAGIALDAAARGLQVALVERGDLASGTSSKSSKLIHGGLRYLAQGDLRLVRESVAERETLRRVAPHLVRPQPFLVPARGADAWRYGAGLWVYRALATGRGSQPHRHLTGSAWSDGGHGLVAPLDAGGYAFSDCRTDDARLVLQVARLAHGLGADILTRAEVIGLHRAGGRVVGATVRDRLGGPDLQVDARWVVAATGVWADETRQLGGAPPLLHPSKGVHLVFDVADLPLRNALIVPSAGGDGRSVFAIPTPDATGTTGQVMVGTTDEHHAGGLDDAAVEPDDAAYLCAALNAAFGTNLGAGDAVGAWAGLRPLARPGPLDDGPADSESLSRRHAILVDPPGLLAITGGKLTTYRRMAADAVDVVARDLGRRRPSPTAGIPLGLRGSLADAVTRVRQLCETLDVDPAVAEHLVERHGDDAARVLSLAVEAGETGPLVDGLPYLEAEVRWAVTHELALDVADVLERRTQIAWRHRAAGGAAVEVVADRMGDLLGWSAAQRRAHAAGYRAAVAAERGPVPLAGGAPVAP